MLRALIVLMVAVGMASAVVRADATPQALDRISSSFAQLDGSRVHYKSVGKGDTALVFVHGWTADIRSWRFQVPAFAGKMRLILIDLPGHGQSDKPHEDYTMDFFARAIDAVLKDAGVRKAVLVGHSMGTPVIRQFYRLYPEKTAGLVAVDGALRRFPMTQVQLDRFVARFSGPDFKANHAKFIAGMFTKNTPAAVRKDLLETLPTAPQEVAVSAMKAMFTPAIWKDDPITVPLLAVVARSPGWTADYEAYVRKLGPDVEYRSVDGVGHFLMLEKPDAFNGILMEFLRKHGLIQDQSR